ncbi:winged helix-turn-helix transcriptional regulator [Candidatus Woesearchaeota archaeon]|nr:winged helix-turn-helix transcriptional regulator [Candidatus Woesearchaeota archaeon]
MKQAWVVALLLLPIVLATNIETAETTLTIEGNKALIEANINLTPKEDIGNLTLILTQQAHDIEVKIDGNKTNCLVQAEYIRCGAVKNGTHAVNITYETYYPIAESGDNTIIRYTDRLPYPAEKQEITLKLPIGYIIPREKGKDESFYISPKPKETYSDGQRIILYWEQKGQEIPISVISRQVVGGGFPAGWVLLILGIITASAGTTYYILRKRIKPQKTKPAKKKPAIVPTLIDNEQKVVNFLKENGEVWQKQIQQATGFSKAKVSRIIRNLEERGVITKTIYGNTNKITLKQK